jgi:hypothetical protein
MLRAWSAALVLFSFRRGSDPSARRVQVFHSPEGIDCATNWDPGKKGVIRYEVGADGRLSKGIAFST